MNLIHLEWEKAIQAGYDELYSTAPDALEKRIKLLDDLIDRKAIEKVNSLVDIARNEQERDIKKREENMDLYINAMAKTILKENEKMLGPDITDRVEEKLEDEEDEIKEKKEKKEKKIDKDKKLAKLKEEKKRKQRRE